MSTKSLVCIIVYLINIPTVLITFLKVVSNIVFYYISIGISTQYREMNKLDTD